MSGKRIYSICLLVAFLVCACEPPLPILDGMDLVKWKDDKHGCNGDRSAMVASLETQRNKLQGLTEMQIIELLGRPDQTELYKRNQKFFIYFLQPGPTCNNKTEKPLKLSIRFNATERAKEVAIE